MSHGRVHDAKGVKGTHLKGTVPKKAVLDSIPDTVGSVGQIAEKAEPGKQGQADPGKKTITNMQFDAEKNRRGVMIDGEGDLVLPGGNRSDQAFATTRTAETHPAQVEETWPEHQADGTEPSPGAETVAEDGQVPESVQTHEDVTASQIRRAVAEDEAQAAEEAPAEPAEALEEPETPQDTPEAPEAAEEAPEAPEETPWPQEADELADWLSRRKIQRGKVAELAAWCGIFEVDPEEYVEEGESVTGDLMRTLIVEHLDETYGIEIEL